MANFKEGDRAAVRVGPNEISVTVIAKSGLQKYMVQSEDGSGMEVHESNLLCHKGPFFHVRGLVFTTSSVHPDQQGEIVSVGVGPNDKKFYQVRFADNETEWFGDDQVFVKL